ncbi:MAG TPA: S4 domain-containing protein, partial [Aestuariivirga sp.]|nr:S4 domain-containing protein [Aestuariivirga sp.]
SHGHIKVNGRRATISSIRLKVGDTVELTAKAKELAVVIEAMNLAERDTPDYVEVNQGAGTARMVRIPGLSDVPFPVQMQPNLVVEYYSR